MITKNPLTLVLLLICLLFGQLMAAEKDPKNEVVPNVGVTNTLSADFNDIPDVASSGSSAISLGFSDENEEDDDEDDEGLADTDLISVDFPGEEIRTILRNIAGLFNLNLVIPDTLVGNASIKLRKVTWRQVFEIVLKPVGYTFTEKDNIIIVVSLEQINQEPMTIRTFPIKYAKASEVAESLAPIIASQGGGTIQVDKRSNTIIVKDRPSVLFEIDNLLSQSTLDRPSMQVMIETKFIEVAMDQGIDPNAPEGLGLNWWGQVDNNPAPFTDGAEFLTMEGQLDFFNNLCGSFFKSAILSAPVYKMALCALETTNNASLVASPTVVVLNNEEANFHVGKNQPIIEANFDETTGNITVGEVEYRPIGVEVSVTPRINEGAEQISLEIKPRISRIVGEVKFQGIISYPIEAIRETETRVSIKDGYTLALGGLIQDDETDNLQKVPLLGDLPGCFGRIFQKKKKMREKINLIMFITAKALNPDGSTYLDIIDPRQIAAMGISDYEIPGYANGIDMPGMKKMTEGQRQLLQQLKNIKHDDSACKDNCETVAQIGDVRDSFCQKETKESCFRPCTKRRSHRRSRY